jgi:hypothetical protein
MSGRVTILQDRFSFIPHAYLMGMIIFLWISLAAWAISSPIGASPDEDFHQTHIYCAANLGEQCQPNGKRYGHCFSMRPLVSASCSTYSELKTPLATQINWAQYPPLYYKTMSWLVGDTLSATTVFVRLANVTLAIFFLLGSIAFSQPILRPAIALSWMFASMPVGMYFMSSMNPSAWVIISIASIWGPLLTLLRPNFLNYQQYQITKSEHSGIDKIYVSRLIFILLAAIFGLGSRSEAVIWLPLTILIMFGLCLPSNFYVYKNKISRLTLFVIISFLILLSLVFIQFGLIRLKIVLSTIESLNSLISNYFSIMNWSMVQHTFNILAGAIGLPGVPGSGLGTHDVPVPAIAIVFIGYGLSGCFLLTLQKPFTRKILLLSLLMAFILIITSFLWTLHNWDYLQPRYFLPIFYVLLGIALLPHRDKTPGTKSQWATMLIGLVIANSLILLSILLRFMHGLVYQKSRYPLTPNAPDIDPSRLFTQEIPNWWWKELPLSPSDIWIVGSLSFALSMFFLWKWLEKSFATEG